MPGISVADPSVLVMVRSADGLSVSVSVAVLLPAVGSVVPVGVEMVAVLAREPVAPAAIVAVSV